MLYHSVIEAGLQVDKRVPHSWASDYVDVGTDATVTWDGANFKFTNNTDYPVAIHAVYGDCWVTVEIFGRRLPDGQKIKFFGTEYITNEEPDGEEYEADPTLAVGKKERDRKPHNHILCKAFIVTYDADGNEISRKEVLTEYRAIMVRMPDSSAGIFSLVCKRPVHRPARQPHPMAHSDARYGSVFFTISAQATAAPRGSEPSTDRSATSRTRYVI